MNKANIDVKWSEQLVGWVGYKSQSLNDGKVQLFDVESQKWMILLLDSDNGTDYPMAYTAIYQYVNTEASTFEDFNVSPDPVLEGIEEHAGVDNTIYKVTGGDEWEKIDKNNLPENNNTARVIEPIP